MGVDSRLPARQPVALHTAQAHSLNSKLHLCRRRAGDEALDAEVLRLIVDDAGNDTEPSASADQHSPRTREALAAMFAERRPTRNMCGPPACFRCISTPYAAWTSGPLINGRGPILGIA
jgi:hypothetical protein